jgi:hypothetical protein
MWLNSPHPDLDETRPIELLKEKKPDVVAELLEDALLGHPGLCFPSRSCNSHWRECR